ncbi:hypothetical protein [Hymenobacter sp. GOD-10R]|uniref:hypothetical protein n=1 Tax=Hymenobacter sp. GOD-10R TaxID=3093922 RepID=UPI002D77785F|nr:hypothetical protein [Hymenobacter sp. GOD-10R]WRQ27562.1 hypothetical protein SD425_21055 [Hymenobacter sp. GOD-10R]
MAVKSNYLEQVSKLSAAIDIAINSIRLLPPDGWNDHDINSITNYYLSLKDEVLYPKPMYKNLKSLKYSEVSALTYFQESSGKTVDYFWRQVDDARLGYRRQNKMLKILKRKRIKSSDEYDFVIDVLLVYQQEGKITTREAEDLNEMIAAYEKNADKNDL